MWLRTRRCELSAFDIVGCGLYCALVIIRSDVLWYLVDRWRVDSFYLAEPPYIQLVHSLIMQCTSAAADDVLILLFSFFSLLMVIYYDPIFLCVHGGTIVQCTTSRTIVQCTSRNIVQCTSRNSRDRSLSHTGSMALSLIHHDVVEPSAYDGRVFPTCPVGFFFVSVCSLW